MADKKAALQSATPTLGTYGGFEVPNEVSQKLSKIANGEGQNEVEAAIMAVESIPSAWTQAYQECSVELGRQFVAMKTSAAERTVPLFDPPFEDEYFAKRWREAYERCTAECYTSDDAGRMEQWQAQAVKDAVLPPELNAASAGSVSTTEAELRCPACIDEPVRCEACRGFLMATGATGPERGATGPGGVIPPHVLAELGMHPALVDEPVRNRASVRAKHEGWPTDWIQLQEKAPTGFFARVLKEMDMDPGERLSVLVDAMQARGLKVGAYDVAGWSRIQRNVARQWIAQNSERPPFFDKYEGDQAGTLGSCAACERFDKRPFTHTCEKGEALGESNQVPPPVVTPAAEPRRGKGRPPGAKNKAPKEWKKAYERVIAELGVS